MARGDYGPEIRTAMATGKAPKVNTSPPRESIADQNRDKARGISENSAQDAKLDAQPRNQAPQPAQGAMPPQFAVRTPGAAMNLPLDAHHVAAATSIAHAILGGRGVGGGGMR